jgi:hypothetical protein
MPTYRYSATDVSIEFSEQEFLRTKQLLWCRMPHPSAVSWRTISITLTYRRSKRAKAFAN